jgi:hypothetical protein
MTTFDPDPDDYPSKADLVDDDRLCRTCGWRGIYCRCNIPDDHLMHQPDLP